MIPRSISYIRYVNDGVYLTIMWALICLQLIEGFYLNNKWLLGAAAWTYGVQFADRYRDNKAVAYGHYTYALGLIIFWLGATGFDWGVLVVPSILTAISAGLLLINKKWNVFILVFEISIFITTQIKLCQT